MTNRGFTTGILHSDRQNAIEHGSLHKPIHTSIAYGQPSGQGIADVFQGKQAGFTYSRQVNPTVNALEDKITGMEQGIASICFSTGMAAITATMLSLLKSGDHVVSSTYLFGNTNSFLMTLANFGIEVTFVDATDVNHVREACRPTTRLVFTETIANPCTQVSDLDAIGQLCAERGVLYVVDNTMTSPYLFHPKTVKAGLVINSLSKYICGHGNALGGSITDCGTFDWTRFDNILPQYRSGDPSRWGLQQIRKKGLRDTGATLAPHVAHTIATGAETLALRMPAACANAAKLAAWFSTHPKVNKVYYPGLAQHPQNARTKQLFRYPGAIMSIELIETIDCLAFLDKLRLAIISTNLGDNRTLALPVAQTIYHEMGPERRAEMGIGDATVRLSVGIEDYSDLEADFQQALDAC